ncbi:MAG: thioredoxin TrxC [Opitutaceae bacterium]
MPHPTSTAVVTSCAHCGTGNRIPETRLSEGPKCGRCGRPVFSGKPIELNAETFDRVTGGDLPVVVDFWAPWCGPCRTMAPEFERATASLEPRIRTARLNTEDHRMIGARLAIRSIPTMVLFRQGRELARHSGAVPAAEIIRWVTTANNT